MPPHQPRPLLPHPLGVQPKPSVVPGPPRRIALQKLPHRDHLTVLYEVEEPCNAGASWQGPARNTAFQSSTRSKSLATTPKTPPGPQLSYFNPLRGRRALQPEEGAGARRTATPHFNPLRGRRALQLPPKLHQGHSYHISILYEVEEPCNPKRGPGHDELQRHISILYEVEEPCNVAVLPPKEVLVLISILYEVEEPCNPARPAPRVECKKHFNPLRGRRALQLRLRSGSGSSQAVFQSSTRSKSLATTAGPRRSGRGREFQSSTRSKSLATQGGGLPVHPVA